jgi:hypothetical protein
MDNGQWWMRLRRACFSFQIQSTDHLQKSGFCGWLATYEAMDAAPNDCGDHSLSLQMEIA